MLIPHVLLLVESGGNKGWPLLSMLSLRDGPASYQLVGKVMAYQGNDG